MPDVFSLHQAFLFLPVEEIINLQFFFFEKKYASQAKKAMPA